MKRANLYIAATLAVPVLIATFVVASGDHTTPIASGTNVNVVRTGDTYHYWRQFRIGVVTEDYFRRSGLDIKLDHGVDNMAMAISLVASTRGVALMPNYAKNLLPPAVVSRPLEGETPTIDIAVGYSKSNTSPVLELFVARLDELVREG